MRLPVLAAAVDFLAFGALALAGLVMLAVVYTIATWLLDRARGRGNDGYYSGL